ncbi:MAG: hypothetical protein J6N51_17080 [Selenomonas sp.]|nr:hypothetical protein [Selenomonas sp.]MBP3231122.1 hypothetical protein [Anaerovibrio sp.]MBP3731044.1 hypothetical protein [Mailhella sp.]
MTLEIKAYGALPCAAEKFVVNGKEASLEDFGDVKKESMGAYRCRLSGFKAKMPTSAVLDEYGISVDEYKELVEKLDDVFYYGACGYCV